MSNWLNKESFEHYKDKLDLEHEQTYIKDALYNLSDEPDTELEKMVLLKAVDTAMLNCGTFSMDEILDQEKQTLTECYNTFEIYEQGFLTLDEESIVYDAVAYDNFLNIDRDSYVNVNQLDNDADEYKSEFADLDEDEKGEYSNIDNIDSDLLDKVKEYCSDENEAIYVALRIEEEKSVSKSDVVDYYVELFEETKEIPEHLYQWDDENIEMHLRTSGAMSETYVEVADEIYAHIDRFTYEYNAINTDALRNEILDEMSLAERVELLVDNPELREEQADHFEEVTDAMMAKLEFVHTLEGQDRQTYIQALVSEGEAEADLEEDFDFAGALQDAQKQAEAQKAQEQGKDR